MAKKYIISNNQNAKFYVEIDGRRRCLGPFERVEGISEDNIDSSLWGFVQHGLLSILPEEHYAEPSDSAGSTDSSDSEPAEEPSKAPQEEKEEKKEPSAGEEEKPVKKKKVRKKAKKKDASAREEHSNEEGSPE